LQRAYVELGMFEKAMQCTSVLRKKLPSRVKDWDSVDAFCSKEIRDMDLIKSYEKILSVTPEEERQKIYDSIPESIAKYPPFYRNKTKARPVGTKVLAIYCGWDDTQEWGPESIKKGIGGSEEAVINISKEFADMGWTVEVYNNCTNEGEIDGVNWYQTAAANPDDLVDLCILWRHPHLVTNAPKGRQTWLWNHDLCDGMEPYYSEEIMEQIDRVMFLSHSHRNTAPWVEDEKVMITSNGIDPRLIVDGENDANTVIYASSPDRGLDTLLSYWDEVKAAKPDARLKVFYGFNKWFDQRYAGNKEMLQWKQDLLDQMESDPTITYYGSVGQDVLAKEISSSGVWAYPTHFAETNCITAMKMQAGGAIPVCTNYAALHETVKFGVKMGGYEVQEFDPTEFKKELIDMIGNEEKQKAIRSDMKKWSKENFVWKQVANQWLDEFRSGVSKKKEKVTK
jgi:glycosyltransferase involved in cell wall biosynthesis